MGLLLSCVITSTALDDRNIHAFKTDLTIFCS